MFAVYIHCINVPLMTLNVLTIATFVPYMPDNCGQMEGPGDKHLSGGNGEWIAVVSFKRVHLGRLRTAIHA
jgi:hypothetical protein